MSRVAAMLLHMLAAVAAVAAVAAPAGARAAGFDLEGAGAEFPARAYTVHTPSPLALAADDVTVRENGADIEDVTVESATGGGAAFATVLVIDASNSMRGEPIAGAIEAARAFADRRAEDQLLGVVTFNNDSDVLLPLTADAEEIDGALAEQPALAKATELNDAVAAALDLLAGEDVAAGSIVVLSDGADTGSESSAVEVASAGRDAGVRIFPVALRSRSFDPGALDELAVGAPVADAADPDGLARIFDRIGADLASEHLLGWESSAGSGQRVTVEVTVAGVDGTATAQYETPSASRRPTTNADEGLWGSRAAMFAAVAIAASMLGFALFMAVRPRRETVRERLLRFVSHGGHTIRGRVGGQADEGGHGPLSRIEQALAGRDWWDAFKVRLEIAKIETPAVRIAAATTVGTAGVALFATQVLDAAILFPLALVVPFGVRVWINRRLRKERRAFADQLPDSLQLIASALRAGQSMAAAFSVVVDEAPEPARGEFERIVNDERLGVPLEEAIRHVARRMDNRDLEQVALVAMIQRETGGNTAEVLDQVIATIRERGALRRLMETLTAQGRLTQIIISVLPIVLLVAITLLNREYMDPLFETSGGRIALTIGAALSVIGSLIIKRVVEVRV